MDHTNHQPTVFVVDEDAGVRRRVAGVVRTLNLPCKAYASGLEFLDEYDRSMPGCLVTEVRMMAVSGLQIQRRLLSAGATIPVIFLAAHTDVPTIVKAMRKGATHFLEKPFRDQELWEAIQEAIHVGQERRRLQEWQEELESRITTLTVKERRVLQLIAQDKPNRAIASELGVGVRTVEIHRAKLMTKLGVSSLPELRQVAEVATQGYLEHPGPPVE